jgi:hypothetical protein
MTLVDASGFMLAVSLPRDFPRLTDPGCRACGTPLRSGW